MNKCRPYKDNGNHDIYYPANEVDKERAKDALLLEVNAGIISTMQAEIDELKKAKYELFDMLETVHLGRFTHVELFVLLEKHRSK